MLRFLFSSLAACTQALLRQLAAGEKLGFVPWGLPPARVMVRQACEGFEVRRETVGLGVRSDRVRLRETVKGASLMVRSGASKSSCGRKIAVLHMCACREALSLQTWVELELQELGLHGHWAKQHRTEMATWCEGSQEGHMRCATSLAGHPGIRGAQGAGSALEGVEGVEVRSSWE